THLDTRPDLFIFPVHGLIRAHLDTPCIARRLPQRQQTANTEQRRQHHHSLFRRTLDHAASIGPLPHPHTTTTALSASAPTGPDRHRTIRRAVMQARDPPPHPHATLIPRRLHRLRTSL